MNLTLNKRFTGFFINGRKIACFMIEYCYHENLANLDFHKHKIRRWIRFQTTNKEQEEPVNNAG